MFSNKWPWCSEKLLFFSFLNPVEVVDGGWAAESFGQVTELSLDLLLGVKVGVSKKLELWMGVLSIFMLNGFARMLAWHPPANKVSTLPICPRIPHSDRKNQSIQLTPTHSAWCPHTLDNISWIYFISRYFLIYITLYAVQHIISLHYIIWQSILFSFVFVMHTCI